MTFCMQDGGLELSVPLETHLAALSADGILQTAMLQDGEFVSVAGDQELSAPLFVIGFKGMTRTPPSSALTPRQGQGRQPSVARGE